MKPIFLALAAILLLICYSGSAKDLTEKDVALLEEMVHLRNTLGVKVWENWKSTELPVLFKKQDYEYLIDHSAPPEDFKKYRSKSLGKDVWRKKSEDSLEYQAAYDINGINTIVISAPRNDYSPCLWVLKAIHESFHMYQSLIRPKDPFQGKYQNLNELNFPFNYQDKAVKAWGQIEAIYIFQMLKKPIWTASDSIDVQRFFSQGMVFSPLVFEDSSQLHYKQLLEWSEGTAKYTEREVAYLAAEDSYTPSSNFLKHYENEYKEIRTQHYGENSIFNPIRFVYQGVQGRLIFYYSGLAKCYLLDRINPDWKNDYLKCDLDHLISAGSTKASCNSDD